MKTKKYISIISMLFLPSLTIGCTNNNSKEIIDSESIMIDTKENKKISIYNPSDMDTNIYQYDKQNIKYR